MKTANANYMKLKRESMIKASQPTRIVKQLDHVVQTYKPVSDHKHNVSYSLFSPKKISIIYGRDFIVLNRDFLKSIFSTERIWRQEEIRGQEGSRWQGKSPGHALCCFWETSVLQYQGSRETHQSTSGN